MRSFTCVCVGTGLLAGLAAPASSCPEPRGQHGETDSPQGAGSPNDGPSDLPSSQKITLGPRLGVSVNADQYIVGGHVLFENLCLKGVGIEPIFLVGFGGNHATLRPGVRVGYTFWIGGPDGLGLMLGAGATLSVATPVGSFSSFCHDVRIEGCGWTGFGFEAGGALRYGWVRLEAQLGFEELPVLTTTLALDYPLWEG
ncbi:MAG: hypothetical protein HYV07_00635 [Deltaproteobacteria bacterium]|nr:hypothetical protein [Deltaproteobacteria bacterium]